MDSEDLDLPGPSSSNGKNKRTRKSSIKPLESGYSCIASAMSKVINNMVDKQLQQYCVELLEVEDVNDVEARIYNVLQQIDLEREDEQKIKDNAKKRRIVKNNN